MKKEYTEKEKKDLALRIASMLGHSIYPDNYSEGMYETIRQYESLTGDKAYNDIIPKDKPVTWWEKLRNSFRLNP